MFRHDAAGALGRAVRTICGEHARCGAFEARGPGRWTATLEFLRGANDGAHAIVEITRAAASIRLLSQASLPAQCLTGVYRDRGGREYRMDDESGRPLRFDLRESRWRPVALPSGEGPCALSLQPDGHVHAIERTEDGCRIFRLHGGSGQRVGETQEGQRLRVHAVLPDGRAYGLVHTGEGDRLMAFGEGPPRALVSHPSASPVAGMWTHVVASPDGEALWLVGPSGGARERRVHRVDPAQVQPDGTLKAEPLDIVLPQFASGFVHTLDADGRAALHVLFHEPMGGNRTWCSAWDQKDGDWRLPGLLFGRDASPVAVFLNGQEARTLGRGRRESPVVVALHKAIGAMLQRTAPTAPVLPTGGVPRRQI